MKTITCNRVTDSELGSHPAQVLMLDTLEIQRDGPVQKILAGVSLPDGDGPGLARLVKVEYHYGWKSWVLSIEHSAQIATRYERKPLPDAIAAFEAIVGVEIPDLRVIEYGVGVYGAQTRYAARNPFALVNGLRYQVQSKARGIRQFEVEVRDGRTFIAFLDAVGGPVHDETFEPAVVLSMDDWRSLIELA